MSEGSSAIVVSTSIRHVCVYRSGAIVTRAGETPLATLPAEFSVEDLPLSLSDSSVRVKAPDGLLVSGVRVSLTLPAAGETPETEQEAAIRRAEESVANLERGSRRLAAAQARREKIEFSLPVPIEDEPPRPAPAAAWNGVVNWLHDAAVKDSEERQRLTDELTAAREKLARLQRERAEARKKASARVEKVKKRVTFRLEGPASGPAMVEIEYRVPGACWVPSYVVRISPKESRATIGMKALVAQASGEAWERVRLSVSTAEPLQANRIPDLLSLRIGRRQPATPETGYREPPEGLDELFSTVDLELAKKPLPQEPPRPQRAQPPTITSEMSVQMEERVSPKAEGRAQARPPAPAVPPSMPVPVPAPAQAPAPMPATVPPPGAAPASLAGGIFSQGAKKMKTLAAARSRSAGADADGFALAADEMLEAPEAEPLEPAPAALKPREFDYASYRLAPWSEPPGRRGKLRITGLSDQTAELGLAAREAKAIEDRLSKATTVSVRPALPAGARPVRDSAGAFDYRYDSEAVADIPFDGVLHTVPILQREAPVRFEMVAVPRERLEAYRTARLMNPLAVPLLAGPADVYLGEEFLVRSPLKTVPAGGELVLGLGVEEAVKISRNTFFTESSHGLLGGGLSLVHRVEIETASRLPSTVQMDVRERVPVLAEKEEQIEIVAVESSPPWTVFDQAPDTFVRGGKRWLFSLGPGETKKLSYTYTVRIDAKDELVGGNRRES